MNSDAYHAFMLDHAVGALSTDMALAAELHILLCSTGHEAADIWSSAKEVMGTPIAEMDALDHACQKRRM